MSDLGFPQERRIGQTHVGSDKHLYYWTGLLWKDLGSLDPSNMENLALQLGENLYYDELGRLCVKTQIQADWKEYNSESPAYIKNIPPGLALVKNITYEVLKANGDIGTGADQVAQGNHVHDFSPAGAYVLEIASGVVNGTNTDFTSTFPFIPTTVSVYVNGLEQGSFTIVNTTKIRLPVAPKNIGFTDVVKIAYFKQ